MIDLAIIAANLAHDRVADQFAGRPGRPRGRGSRCAAPPSGIGGRSPTGSTAEFLRVFASLSRPTDETRVNTPIDPTHLSGPHAGQPPSTASAGISVLGLPFLALSRGRAVRGGVAATAVAEPAPAGA